jgi:hypothetical protein
MSKDPKRPQQPQPPRPQPGQTPPPQPKPQPQPTATELQADMGIENVDLGFDEGSHEHPKSYMAGNFDQASFEFRLADELTDEMFAVMLGFRDMGEGRKRIREWWRSEGNPSTNDGQYMMDGQKYNRIEYIRKMADKVKGIAEAMTQEIRTLSLERHSG